VGQFIINAFNFNILGLTNHTGQVVKLSEFDDPRLQGSALRQIYGIASAISKCDQDFQTIHPRLQDGVFG